MRSKDLRRRKMIPDDLGSPETSTGWLWHGYLHKGDITLLTSQWKTGKTTLVAGLLRQLEHGGEFLGRTVKPGKALVVSEESPSLWASRLKAMPIGAHVELLARPFRGRPSIDDWNALIDDAIMSARSGELDLFVVDPLAAFLPGRSESDVATLLEMLQPLQRLCQEGCSVLILHHPRKKPSEPGASARGSGALLGYVDIVLELSRYGRLASDFHRRQIFGQSRREETPERQAYEWNPATGLFAAIADPAAKQFEENWQQVNKILQGRESAATHLELLNDWPGDQQKPRPSTFYEWLNRAYSLKRLRREGKGTNRSPYRYRLPNEDDKYYDRGQLPPLKPLGPLFG